MAQLNEMRAKPKPPAAPKPGKCSSITIRRAQNGFVVECQFEPGKTPGKAFPKPLIASSFAEACGALAGAFGEHIPHFGDGGIVDKPTLAVVGEKGPEEVKPIHALRKADTPGGPSSEMLGERSWQVTQKNSGEKSYRETTPGHEALSDQQLKDWNGWNDQYMKARQWFSDQDKAGAQPEESELDRHYRLAQDIKRKRDESIKLKK